MGETRSDAPGRLQQVRLFLNTWRLPHETRTPVDDLPSLAGDRKAWRAQLPDLPVPRDRDLEELDLLRTDLRTALGRPRPTEVGRWLTRYPVRVTLEGPEPLGFDPAEETTVAVLVAIVVQAVNEDQWSRLKACPDCRHVFYDHSRNRSRTWCGMYAGAPEGRACGSIAKVRAYRARQATR